MKKFNYTIKDQLGLHARPVSNLVKILEKYNIEAAIIKGDKSAQADHLLALMQLGVKKGDTITVEIDGPDEEFAEKEIETFFCESL
ncbi:HPr family phosphocarrier protein [Lacrimispora indolis]|mgnify:CR=1 FL=1|uniref:HPr family phosphocarrier protein n=1 Tax=Lacrimispora indolis TaxID=69825 RepID=UPI0003F809AE|nr:MULTISPECIES: HPr family phosphocarrier protein [Lachnospiraceae]MBE7718250.1 HPr family phosphocarrier protein [Lacrimispora celerecrescens]